MQSEKMKDSEFDVIVIGLGGHGSATIAYLSSYYPSLKVLGVEQFSVTHKNGSSHGRSRIYRQAYFEHPSYVPLLQRGLELWKELQNFHETKWPEALHRPLNLCGGVMIGPTDSEVIEGTLASIREHHLPHEILSPAQMKEKFQVFELSNQEIGIWESNAGYLNPEVCIETYISLAQAKGATVNYDETFLRYEQLEEGEDYSLKIITNRGEYRCKKLILTVGAWAKEMYGEVLPENTLTIERRVLFWFAPTEPDNATLHRYFKDIPIYIWDLGRDGHDGEVGNFYGFPEQVGFEGSIKVAFHSTRFTGCISPATIDREVRPEEVEMMRKPLRSKIPLMAGELLHTETCMYTTTPDNHFLIDFHPQNPRVLLASPCSGHGFKFCSVIGEVLSQLAVTGSTPHNIDLFRIRSFPSFSLSSER